MIKVSTSSVDFSAMGSLHRIARSPCWYFAYRLANGQHALRSTGETSWTGAKIKCDAMQAMVDEEKGPDTDREFVEDATPRDLVSIFSFIVLQRQILL